MSDGERPAEGSRWRHPSMGWGTVSFTPAGHIMLTFKNGLTATYRDAVVFHKSGLLSGDARKA